MFSGCTMVKGEDSNMGASQASIPSPVEAPETDRRLSTMRPIMSKLIISLCCSMGARGLRQ